MLPISELEARIAAAILALNGDTERLSRYQQGELAPSWSESRGWGADLEGGRARMHLQFQVITVDSPVADRGARGEPSRVLSRVQVLMTYRCRPTNLIADLRLARDACLDLCGAVNALNDQSDEISVDVVNLGENPALTADREVLLIVPTFDVGHDVVL